jgi:hypothetical protein
VETLVVVNLCLAKTPSGRKKALVRMSGTALKSIFYWRCGILDATEDRECRAERAAKDWQTHISPSFLFYSEEKCSSSGEIVTMVQTAEPGHRYDLAASYGIRPYFAPSRCTLREREMRAVVIIVADVLFHEPSQMTFLQHDYMVEQISSTTAHPAFGDAALPRGFGSWFV